jgi:curved DNA-binding protein CbpA
MSVTEAFTAIGVAYEILTDPVKREVFDRLGSEGLRRLQDGDPRVMKWYLPPDEVLRRHLSQNDPPLSTMDWIVTSLFAWLEGKPQYD